MKKKVLVVMMLVLCLITVAACSGNNGGTESEGNTGGKKTNLTLVTGGMSGSWFAGGAKMAEIWGEKIEGVNVTSTDGGAESNTRVVSKGVDAHIGMTWLPWFYDAMEGDGMFDTKENIKAIANIHDNYGPFYIATAKSGIKGFNEISGTRFLAGYTGSGMEYSSRFLLEYAGMSYDSIEADGGEVLFADYTEASSLMKDGHIDVFCLVSGSPGHAVPLEIQNYVDIQILTTPKEIGDGFIKNHPGFYWRELPANTYKNQTEGVDVIGYNSTLICNADMDEELIYNLTKTLIEDAIDPLVEVNPVFQFMKDKENLIAEIAWENIHPGAQRYYEEIGLAPAN